MRLRFRSVDKFDKNYFVVTSLYLLTFVCRWLDIVSDLHAEHWCGLQHVDEFVRRFHESSRCDTTRV